MTPVEELREAARLMRERAEKATPGPWVADISEIYSEFVGGPWVGETLHIDDSAQTTANGAHIAGMHPAVALAVAAWLAGVAAAIEMGDLHPETYPVIAEVTNARAVARAYLGDHRADG